MRARTKPRPSRGISLSLSLRKKRVSERERTLLLPDPAQPTHDFDHTYYVRGGAVSGGEANSAKAASSHSFSPSAFPRQASRPDDPRRRPNGGVSMGDPPVTYVPTYLPPPPCQNNPLLFDVRKRLVALVSTPPSTSVPGTRAGA
ncbi:hypothetical protein LX32DRAFT_337257 [Colletotrichum zoysiae]|uniref:Uncharacterized protein n=1 Tax=Colletotrichum zoysiae TaxID=1216348 RepID=A0AAD9H1V5_9PEZI|nr:hypothetical protein LX32DRAFT_337257 [Colletotrichum zoysiae]